MERKVGALLLSALLLAELLAQHSALARAPAGFVGRARWRTPAGGAGAG